MNSESNVTQHHEHRKKSSTLRRLSAKVLLVLGGLLVGLLLIEIGLRIVGVSHPRFFQYDDLTGGSLRPNAKGRYRKEGDVYIRINSYGQRDREHTIEKPQGTLRIAVLGDSYAEAFQVEMEHTFWTVFETQLRTCPDLSGQSVEVLNFGKSGYGTAQELLTLRHKVWQFSPDIIVLAFLSGNDLRNNLRELEQTDSIPYFVRREGELVLDDSFRKLGGAQRYSSHFFRTFYFVHDHFRIVQVLNEIRGRFRNFQRARSKTKREQSDAASADSIGLDDNIYFPPRNDLWSEAWAVTEELLLLLKEEVESNGAKLLVVGLSNPPQVHTDAQFRERFQARLNVENLFYPDRRLEQFCAERKIHALLLAPKLAAYAEEHETLLHGFGDNLGGGHWNENGHRVAGELIAPALCALIASEVSQ